MLLFLQCIHETIALLQGLAAHIKYFECKVSVKYLKYLVKSQ